LAGELREHCLSRNWPALTGSMKRPPIGRLICLGCAIVALTAASAVASSRADERGIIGSNAQVIAARYGFTEARRPT
jgi:hypothetical protein